jgi:ribosomal protein S18 acetylase RimI-like enzyme
LIDAAINTARRQGFKAASLEARPSDNGISPQALVAMYRRQGFKSVGRSDRGSPMMERKL